MMRAVLGFVVWIALSVAVAAETVMVPMRDGVRLATEVVLPASGGPTFGVVLVRTVYGRNSDKFADTVTRHGLAAVLQDTRGYGGSEGEKMMFDADGWGPLRDGEDTMAWVKSQKWCNGRIGTWGASALGITQLFLAPTTDALSSQVIAVAPGGMYATFVRGGVPQKLLSERFAKLMGQQQSFKKRRVHPTYDDYWRGLDYIARTADVTSPAVHVGGWFDLYPQGAIDNFVNRQYLGGAGARGNQKLIMGPWEHGITPKVGALEFPDYQFNWPAYAWRFTEHWLKGNDDPIMREPAVRYYVLGDCDDPQAPGNEWRTAEAWPPFATVATPFYLSGDGRLAHDRPAVDVAPRTFTFDPRDPCASLGGADAIKALPLDYQDETKRADVLAFATEPLTEPLEVTGAVRLKLFVKSDAPDTDFSARLVDVYPDGRQIAIADGIQRVKFRGGFDKPEPLPPGAIGELSLDCWSTSIVFNRGHRIGLHVSSSNWPRYEVNPNTGEDLPKYQGETPEGDLIIDPASVRVAHNAVLLDAAHPSVLILPVRPATAATHATSANPRGDQVNLTKNAVAPRAAGPRPALPRIQPLKKADWTAEQRAILEPLERSGKVYNVFATVANHPDLARDWMTFATHILRRSTLPAREREILILRIGWLCKAEYEWAQHVRIGKAAGLSDDDLVRIAEGPTAAGLSELDKLLLTAVDELRADACLSDATWQALAAQYDQKQMMDLVFTVGQYNLVSMALNSFGVQLDDNLTGFPK